MSSNSKASAVSIRFVLCGAAKLYSFTLQVGDGRTHQEPIVKKKSTAPASEEGASSNDELLPPYAESSCLHDLLGERDTLLSERWEKRAADLRSHAISYPLRAELPIVQALVDAHQFGYEAWRNYVPCVGQRPLTCVFSMAAVADRPADAPSSPRWASRLVDLGHSRSIDGVIGCRQLCKRECPTCEYASMSWSSFRCACFEKCNTGKLALSQMTDDTHPQLAQGRPLAPARGGGYDPLFDWVTFAVDDEPLPRGGLKGKDGTVLRSFPKRMWNTTAEWASDWFDYVTDATNHGLRRDCIPSFMCIDGSEAESRRARHLKKHKDKKGMDEGGMESQGILLDGLSRRMLGGLSPAFAA